MQGGIQKYLEYYGNEEHGLSNRGDNSGAKTEPSESDDVGNNTANDNKACLYRGKNFVFDPRRTDPIIGNGITINDDSVDSSQEKCVSIVGQCNICSCPHDDYDNGHSPSEEKEARCCHCRMLVLVCNGCREKVRCWGEEELEKKKDLFCGKGGAECIDEGNVAEKVETARF